ncbi:MAG: hypothetical protein PQJ46_14545, partial [Spirochaetales bacterium]|nr:hypothetical protein [Spirochaetales bacterium]
VDELLSGTNSVERISASVAIIDYLFLRENIISVIATHDILIAEKEDKKCKCLYLEDTIVNNELKFNYKIKNGIIRSTNAIKMLESLGLPKQIITDANKNKDAFL